jgi:hypothetical protein
LLAPTVIAVMQTAMTAKISIALAVRSRSLRLVMGASALPRHSHSSAAALIVEGRDVRPNWKEQPTRPTVLRYD